jgi:hypothetical protein
MGENAVAVPESPVSTPQPPRRPSAGAILTLVNGVLAGVGSVYVGTRSVLVTVIAAFVAAALAAALILQR